MQTLFNNFKLTNNHTKVFQNFSFKHVFTKDLVGAQLQCIELVSVETSQLS